MTQATETFPNSFPFAPLAYTLDRVPYVADVQVFPLVYIMDRVPYVPDVQV